MSKRNYCSRCGLNITPSIGKSNVQWMISNRITMCEECNPKLWEEVNDVKSVECGETFRRKGIRKPKFCVCYPTKKGSTRKVVK
tara:strand:- start:1081 stop:1332 length:252 start_codon:yes stop_codon:yes gene_type:complete